MEHSKVIPSGPIVITGASGGMGSAATRTLASKGIPIIMACRDIDKAEEIKSKIIKDFPKADLTVMEIHLESFASIKTFAEGLKGVELAGLFNNAGVLPKHYTLSEEGYELSMAVNYLGPWLLTSLLLPQLKDNAAVVNMVSISSDIAHFSEDILHRKTKHFHRINRYATSKLALTYFTMILAERHPNLRVNASDPGIVNTDMIRMDMWFDPLTDVLFRPFCNTPDQGVSPALAALLGDRTGCLYSGKKARPFPGKFASHHDDALRLWNITEREMIDNKVL